MVLGTKTESRSVDIYLDMHDICLDINMSILHPFGFSNRSTMVKQGQYYDSVGVLSEGLLGNT